MVWERAKLAALFSIVAASAGRVDILSEKDRKYLVASIFLYRCTDPSSNLKLLLSRMEAVGFLLALRRASPDLVEAVARGENCPWLFDLVSHFRQHAITESLVERLPYSEYFPVSTAPRRRNSDPSIMLGRLQFAAPDPSRVRNILPTLFLHSPSFWLTLILMIWIQMMMFLMCLMMAMLMIYSFGLTRVSHCFLKLSLSFETLSDHLSSISLVHSPDPSALH
jgi:hypothetical protein